MILAKIYGGLGNQMFQYAAAKALALRNQTALKLDISSLEKPDSHNRVYCLHHFNISAPIATREEIAYYLSNKNKFFKQSKYLLNKTGIGFHPSIWHQTYIYQSYFEKKFLLPLKKDVYLDGYWQNEKLFIDYRNDLLQEFSFISAPGDLNASALDKIHNTNSISLHIRRGDALLPSALKLYKTPDAHYYKKAIAFIASKISHPHFFIFSDDIEWCRQNLETEFPAEFIAHNDDSKNYEDMRLMSNCKHHITANSTFSWWGAWLNSSEEKIVITPAEWFLPKNMNRNNIIPASWIKI